MKLKPFEKRIWLSSPTMHGEELQYMQEAYTTNWMSTLGSNLNSIEKDLPDLIGCNYGVALSCGTAALHMAIRLAGQRLYGDPLLGQGSLHGHRVFCTDMTFGATVNPVIYEGGIPVFIDTERDTWNMDPKALEKAFEIYPDIKLIILVHLYGTPCKIDEIKAIARSHGALIIEDAAESLGATYRGKQTGSFGDYNCISFNGNKIITGSGGGMLLTDSIEDANKVRKWSTQAREDAPWYQHEEIGYNYRMSNVIAGVIRGQLPHLMEHLDQKTELYLRYKDGLKDLPISMNPYEEDRAVPNFWLSCLLIDKDYMCPQVRGERTSLFTPEAGKSCPDQLLQVLDQYNIQGRPIWKPMHLQPVYRMNSFITASGNGRAQTNAYIPGSSQDIGNDIFERGFCLPSDNKITPEQQDVIIELIKSCFL